MRALHSYLRLTLLLGASLLAAVAVAADTRAAASAPDARFGGLAERYVHELGQYAPVDATALGDHSHDGDLDDLSAAGRARKVGWAQALLADLTAIDRSALSRDNQVDAAMLANQLRYIIWSEQKLRDWSWDAYGYSQLTGQAIYGLMSREFAPLPTRLASAASRLEKLSRLLEQEHANLVPERVPAIHAETASKQNPGVTSLIDELIVPQLGSLSEADRTRVTRAIDTARAALQAHQKWLDTELVPKAKGDFRIGRELYDEKLAFALMSPLSRQEIRRRADADVAATRTQMYSIARAVLAGRDGPPTPDDPNPAQQQTAIAAALDIAAADHPQRDGVVPLARQLLAETTAFVRSHDLVTVPEEPLKIIVMPEFQRGQAVAYCDPPGPLDKGQQTYYAVSPVPDAWNDTQVTSFLREYNSRMIAEVTIHEAMPGHYLQLAHSNRNPSVLRSVLGSGPFVEGWAVYAEREMIAAGFRKDDPLMRLINLKLYLRAMTNAIIDSAIHVDGMSREEAMKLMTETGFQEEREAAGKWVRAQLTSAQLSTYFVGYQEHMDLRRAAESRQGTAFRLKDYHDRLLALGSPPVKYARALLLDEPIP
jgi:uncharacterized protein (DUF885 family)